MNKAREEQLNEVLALFYFAYRKFTVKPDRIMEKHGIQRVHHRILYFIARQPGISVNALLKTLEVTKQALHAPMKQLTEMGYITSEPSASDRRVRELYLTEKGKKLEKKLSDVQRKKMEAVFQKLGWDHEIVWREVMEEIAKG
jgi:DNA-binding MarR family transcriptional regulator